MKTSLLSLATGLADLRRYIDLLEVEGRLLGLDPNAASPEELRVLLEAYRGGASATAGKRRFDYTTVIVSLYGFWERFVEDLLGAFVAAAGSWARAYSDLPKHLTDRHVAGSIGHLARIRDGRVRDGASVAEVVRMLHSCLSGASPFDLNPEAFIYHSANIRRETVDDLLKGVGVLNASQRVRDSLAVRPYLGKRFPDRRPGTVSVVELFAPIDELAERRNEAAHGVPGELLGNSLLRDLIDSVEAVANGLFEVVRQDAYPLEALSGLALGRPLQVFSKYVCGVRLPGRDMGIGDRLLIRTRSATTPYREAWIQQIQINNVDQAFVLATTAVDVGVRLDVGVAKTHDLVLLPENRSWIGVK